MNQLVFDFALSHLVGDWDNLDSFVVGDNTSTVALLRQWLGKSGMLEDSSRLRHAYICGQSASGCSRLLRSSCRYVYNRGGTAAYIESPAQLMNGEQVAVLAQSHLMAIDNVDQINRDAQIEEAVYELFDRAQDEHCALLFGGHTHLVQLKCALPDLRSRMANCLQFGLRPLKDDALEALAETLLRECGVNVPPGLGELVLKYCRRDSANLVAFIRTMQSESLRLKAPLKLSFVRKYLQQLHQHSV